MFGSFGGARWNSHFNVLFPTWMTTKKNVEGHLDECDLEISKHHCQFQIIFYSFDNNTSL